MDEILDKIDLGFSYFSTWTCSSLLFRVLKFTPSRRALQPQGPPSIPQTHQVRSSGFPVMILLLQKPASCYCSFAYHLLFCPALNSEAISSERLSTDLLQSKPASFLLWSLVTICVTFLVVFISTMPASPTKGKALYEGKGHISLVHQCSVHRLPREIFLNE